MMRRTGMLAVLLMSACSSNYSDSNRVPVELVFQEGDRAPAKSAGGCLKCNQAVYEGHRCGLTVPCRLCQREAGARHLHEVVWECEKDQVVMAKQHECLDAKTCTTCREDKRSLLGTIGCERCFRQVPARKIQGITTYCGTCNLEVGANHVHAKTSYCRPCLREAGKKHKCDATRYCPSHDEEHAPDHVHGETQYCDRCHRESGPGHRHGTTEWCWVCESEMEWPHCHHD